MMLWKASLQFSSGFEGSSLVTLNVIRFALKVAMLLFPGGNPPAQILLLGLSMASERNLAISVPAGSPSLRGWLASQSAA